MEDMGVLKKHASAGLIFILIQTLSIVAHTGLEFESLHILPSTGYEPIPPQ